MKNRVQTIVAAVMIAMVTFAFTNPEDGKVEVKVDKSGKVRVKAFTRPNDKMIYEESVNYETGIALFFREEFDSFGHLIKEYWNRVFGKNKKDPDMDQVTKKTGPT